MTSLIEQDYSKFLESRVVSFVSRVKTSTRFAHYLTQVSSRLSIGAEVSALCRSLIWELISFVAYFYIWSCMSLSSYVFDEHMKTILRTMRVSICHNDFVHHSRVNFPDDVDLDGDDTMDLQSHVCYMEIDDRFVLLCTHILILDGWDAHLISFFFTPWRIFHWYIILEM